MRSLVVAATLALAGCGADSAATGDPTDPGGGGYDSEVGAELPCPQGELALGDDCVFAGVPSDGCGVGFQHEDGACTPILPDVPCAPGELALPGEVACHSVGPCAPLSELRWRAGTQFVDQAFVGTSDGSVGAPWTTVQQAVDAAPSGGSVAVAPGTYVEDLVVSNPIEIRGTCAAQVTLRGASGPAVYVNHADDVVLRGLALTGPANGVALDGATGGQLSELWVHDTGSHGIAMLDSAAVIDSSLIENAIEGGVVGARSDVTFVRSSVRDVALNADGSLGACVIAAGTTLELQEVAITSSVLERCHGQGLEIQASANTAVQDTLIRDIVPVSGDDDAFGVRHVQVDPTAAPSFIEVSGSVIADVVSQGIALWGGSAAIERTTIRDVHSTADGMGLGAGIRARLYTSGSVASRPLVSIGRTSIVRAFDSALHLNGADADIEQVLISDPQTEAGGRSGFAMQAFPHEGTLEPTIVAMRATRIERSKQAGIVVAGSTGTFDGLEIVDTLGTGGGALGVAFSVIVDWNIDLLGAAELRRSRVAGAHAGGVLVAGGELFVEDVEIRDVEEQANVQDFGDGLGASSLFPLSPGPQASRMIVNRSSVLGSARAGISNFGADVSVSNTFLDCNGIDLDGETVLELPFAFEDAGGNDCGCGTDRVTCKVLTTNIKPPSFL